jgi:rare lipoprotein A
MIAGPSLLRGALLIAALALPPVERAPDSQFGPRPQEGWATFYTRRRAGRRTASGERYDPRALVAAHPTLPFGTRVRVTRLETGKSVIVRVIDRGPAKAERRRGDIIDLSRAAAESLAFTRAGRTRVRLDVVGKAGD